MPKKPKKVFEKDLGDKVVCDICNEEYTNSKESGGFIFRSYAYCPKCAKEWLKKIKEFKEEDSINAVCPKDMSFADFCREYRGENAKITIKEL